MKFFLPAYILCINVSAQVWTSLPDFPGEARDDGACALVNNVAFFGTGLKQDFSASADWYAYDFHNHHWVTVSPMPGARQYACAFAGINGFYVFGGDAWGALNELYHFDLLNMTWSKKSSRPGKGVIGCACAVMAGKAMVIGGKVHHDSVPSPEMWEYNMSNDTWTRKENPPFGGRWRSGTTTLGAYLYLAGGAASAGGHFKNDLWSYDPGTGTWDSLSPVPQTVPVNYSSLQTVGNKLVFFGGQDSLGKFYNNLWYYRAAQGIWEAGPSLPASGRKGGMGLGWNEKFIYTCGLGPGDIRLKETWMLDLPLGVSEEQGLNFSVFPNPFDQELSIEFSEPGRTIYCLFGLDGYEILKGETESAHLVLKLPELARGMYLLQTTSAEGKTRVKKLLRD